MVVLVDDVEDSSDDYKRRILHEQPLIRQCARELILISDLEKQSANMTGSDPRLSPAPISPTMQDAYDSLQNKIYKIQNFMEETMGQSPGMSKQACLNYYVAEKIPKGDKAVPWARSGEFPLLLSSK